MDVSIRKKIYCLLESVGTRDKWSSCYDVFMMTVIVLSIIPLAFKEQTVMFERIDKVTVSIFIVEYILRICTADYALKKDGVSAFLRYPITPFAVIDLLAILPSLTALNDGFRLLKILRLLRTIRVFRVFKLFRYSKSIERIMKVLQKQKQPLIAVCILAAGYILISALVIFNVEPDSFAHFFDAVYWATISLTTVGYGDIYPVTRSGQIVTMISSVLGIAVVALPAGIITAGYMAELEREGER